MNHTETARLLTAVAAIDGRRIDDASVAAWHGMLGDLPFNDCAEAVRRHFARSSDWLMPAHIRDGVRLIRDERRPKVDALALPSRWEPDPARTERIKRGIAKVAEEMSIARANRPPVDAPEEAKPLSPSDVIRERAIARARAQRRVTATNPAHRETT